MPILGNADAEPTRTGAVADLNPQVDGPFKKFGCTGTSRAPGHRGGKPRTAVLRPLGAPSRAATCAGSGRYVGPLAGLGAWPRELRADHHGGEHPGRCDAVRRDSDRRAAALHPRRFSGRGDGLVGVHEVQARCLARIGSSPDDVKLALAAGCNPPDLGTSRNCPSPSGASRQPRSRAIVPPAPGLA
jgi:hypothetical protein